MKNLCALKIRKRELTGVATNHCNQCLCASEEYPTFSANKTKCADFDLPKISPQCAEVELNFSEWFGVFFYRPF